MEKTHNWFHSRIFADTTDALGPVGCNQCGILQTDFNQDTQCPPWDSHIKTKDPIHSKQAAIEAVEDFLAVLRGEE